MGTKILRPQDCLVEQMRMAPSIVSHRGSYLGSSTSKSHRKPVIRSQHKKRLAQFEPLLSKKSTAEHSRSERNNTIMRQVTILKRGEYLDFKMKDETFVKKIVSSTGDLNMWGADPEMVPKQIRITDRKSIRSDDVYAGSAFFLSPSPRSLPLPTFSKKKGLAIVDDSATKDLRRLLRLD